MHKMLMKGAVGIDQVRTFFCGRKAPLNTGVLSFCRKIAFKQSIRILSSVPGKEIKFMDKAGQGPEDFLGWAVLDNGTLDIHYRVKKKGRTGVNTYLTRFSGNDVLEFIFSYFEKQRIDKVECVLQQSNLDAFNFAFAKASGDMLYAVRNTHIGNFFLNLKNWVAIKDRIETFGSPGPMRAGILEPAKAQFDEISAVFCPSHAI